MADVSESSVFVGEASSLPPGRVDNFVPGLLFGKLSQKVLFSTVTNRLQIDFFDYLVLNIVSQTGIIKRTN